MNDDEENRGRKSIGHSRDSRRDKKSSKRRERNEKISVLEICCFGYLAVFCSDEARKPMNATIQPRSVRTAIKASTCKKGIADR